MLNPEEEVVLVWLILEVEEAVADSWGTVDPEAELLPVGRFAVPPLGVEVKELPAEGAPGAARQVGLGGTEAAFPDRDCSWFTGWGGAA